MCSSYSNKNKTAAKELQSFTNGKLSVQNCLNPGMASSVLWLVIL